ncbi:hypothetical protein HYDPIDRAFT_120327 [Hydnomerulius pinastri MD-312]|uniref:Uncharacterized protein n=1 Tax=Hydnomerulius pinastri MD-312 TaxID=994086 RepID=A0A0C9VWZ3_9AGAM|nr:hypothetical protein HYDPIDRAFT_120327 [Hydnomerulius pinastri MD-312]
MSSADTFPSSTSVSSGHPWTCDGHVLSPKAKQKDFSKSSQAASTSKQPSFPGAVEDFTRNLATFDANIKEMYLKTVSASPDPFSHHVDNQSRRWAQAISKKQHAMKKMLEAQKVIEDVENDVRKYLAEDTIESLRSILCTIGDISTPDGRYLSTIEGVVIQSGSSTDPQ